MKKFNFKKVKCFLTILLVGIVIFSFAGCSQSKEQPIKEKPSENLTTTMHPVYSNNHLERISDMTTDRGNHVRKMCLKLKIVEKLNEED